MGAERVVVRCPGGRRIAGRDVVALLGAITAAGGHAGHGGLRPPLAARAFGAVFLGASGAGLLGASGAGTAAADGGEGPGFGDGLGGGRRDRGPGAGQGEHEGDEQGDGLDAEAEVPGRLVARDHQAAAARGAA